MLKLIASNPTFQAKDGFYSPPRDTTEVKVVFTNAAEEQIAAQLSGVDDACCFSSEIEALVGDGEYINVLRPQSFLAFDFSKVTTVLEVSNDYGNLCRFLAENSVTTESIKTSKNSARATSYRCSDLANVGIVCADLESVNIPENYYDLVVLSDIELITKDREEVVDLISRLSNTLTANGLLVLYTQNPQPISSWFQQDQSIPYAGLYGTLANRFAQAEWLNILSDAGLSANNEHCVLPNSQHPRTLLSKDYVDSNPSAVNHFYGAGFTGSSKVNEYLLFSELSKSRNLYELSDSYLTIAARSQKAISSFYDNDFSHFSSPGRRRQWRTLTNKLKSQDKVIKQSLFDQDKSSANKVGVSIAQDLAPQNYQDGQSLAGLWLQSLVHESNSNKFGQYIKDYALWLEENATQRNGSLYDLLPFNLIVDASEQYQVIDPEWRVETGISPEFVLFRALFWFGFHNRHLLQIVASEHGLFSLYDFVKFGLSLIGYDGDLKKFVQLETSLQSVIEKQFNQDAIDETLRLPIAGQAATDENLLQPKAQLFFYEADTGFDFTNSVTLSTSKISTPEHLSFSLKALDVSCNTLRLDPVDRGGFFRISSLQIFDKDNALLLSLESERDIVAAAELSNVVYADSHLGCLFVALNDDPQLIFDLTTINDIERAVTLNLTLTYYSSIDYTLAMQQLGQNALLQQQFIDAQRNELEASKAHYNELNNNFDFLKTNSEKQNQLIEELMLNADKREKQIEQQQKALEDKQDVIEKQLEMMTRAPSTRLKLFIANKLGKVDEDKEAEELEKKQKEEEAIKARQAKPFKLGQTNEDYDLWIKKHELNYVDIQRINAEIEAMSVKPTFSIVVPVYNIDEKYLMMAVDSVRNQLYPHWELCLVDDASPNYHVRPMLKRLMALDKRIVVKLNKNNQGIAGASNDAMSLTNGEYIGLLDHDDELSIDALYENAKVINEFPDVGFIYSDEDKVTMEEVRVDPFFKPDYSPDLLDSNNYICHFSVISQKVIEKIDAFRLGFDGSQDHDLIIRAIHHAERVVHIPKVLYHWRKVPGSTADVYDAKNYAWEAGRKAVAARLELNGDAGEVVLGPLQGTYQVKREIINAPKISIIIPFKDRADLLETCLDSIIEKSTYSNYEIIGVSNNSEEPVTHEVMQAYQTQHENIRFVEKNIPFNFSLLCNYGVSESNGDYVLLLNNDIEIRSPDWLERLLEHAQRDDIGAVGGKLFFPDGRIQHAGVVIGMHGAAGHSHLYFAPNDIGYYGSLMVTRDVSAVTGAMLMVSRQKYDQVEGLDEENLAVAYNDVDLCLKLIDKGYRNIFTPFCHAIHYESASRGYEDNPEKLARLEKEKTHFKSKWQDFLEKGDPCFNPNFDLDNFDFKLNL